MVLARKWRRLDLPHLLLDFMSRPLDEALRLNISLLTYDVLLWHIYLNTELEITSNFPRSNFKFKKHLFT